MLNYLRGPSISIIALRGGRGRGLGHEDDNKNIGLLRLFLFYGRYYGGFTQSGNMRGKLARSTQTLKVFVFISKNITITSNINYSITVKNTVLHSSKKTYCLTEVKIT
jgi:hypothetical protein